MTTTVYPEYTDIIQFIFENGDKMPEGFYIEIMDLIKKYYFERRGENFIKIHDLIENNKNVLDKNILKVLSKRFTKKQTYPSKYFPCICSLCIIILIIFSFMFVIIWSIAKH